MQNNRISVADYLTQQIKLSGVSQKHLAEQLGYPKPNIITMFKQGKTRIPKAKVVPLAKALGLDPIHLLRLVWQEYSPEDWDTLEAILGQRLISANEQQLLALARSVSMGHDIAPKDAEQERELGALFESWAKQQIALATPSNRH
jgi:plasmid maintenance system antidote protein VapI